MAVTRSQKKKTEPRSAFPEKDASAQTGAVAPADRIPGVGKVFATVAFLLGMYLLNRLRQGTLLMTSEAAAETRFGYWGATTATYDWYI